MVSRLDRLFILLDTGSNESVRLAAAKQLGEVQRVQPNDLDYLLQRIKEYSGKSVWETRVAAGQATRCVLEHVNPWPSTVDQASDDKDKCRQYLLLENLIEQNVNTREIFQHFNLDKIATDCPKLLSLEIADNDVSELASPSNSKARGRSRKESTSKARKSDKEQLMRQRKLINKELGIAMVDSLNLGVKSTDIVSNDDLQTDYELNDLTPLSTTKSTSSQHDSRNTIELFVSNYDKIINLLVRGNCISKQTTNSESEKPQNSSQTTSDSKPTDEWPLSTITKQYTSDLFNPSWEIRHGAAIALREIVRSQGTSAGKRLHLSTASNNKLNQLWLVDMALKALSVLVLDKFGDFLFDQVVAPVRENAAQLLGCCVANMSEANACSTVELALKMLENSNWETRHGGILALKYSLNVINESFSKKILKDSFDPIFKCLGDPVDDVSAEAAASLVPVKDLMIETIPEKAPILIKFLWEHLADLDELTTSTSNIVLLLASLITSSSTQLDPNELKKSIPRLWSLLGHSSTSVRVSVIKALITLIKAQKSNCLSWMPEDLLQTALRLVFQRSILENMDEVRPSIEEVWMHLTKIDNTNLNVAQKERFSLLKCTSQFLNSWLCLVMHPSNTPIDRGSQTWLKVRPDGSISDTKPDGEVYIASITFNADTMSQQRIQVTKCRLLGTKLLGALYANLVNDFSETDESQHSKESLKYLSDMFIHYIKTKSANQRVVSGWTIESWASHQFVLLNSNASKLDKILPKSLVEQLNSAIMEISLCYDELASTFTRLQQETRDFVSALKESGVDMNLQVSTDKRAIYNLTQIQTLCDLNIEIELSRIASKRSQNATNDKSDHDITRSPAYTLLATKKANLTKSLKFTNLSQKTLSTSVRSSLACAHISWRLLPQNLNLITEPLMDSIETEEETSLQDKTIKYVVILFDILCQDLKQYNNLIESMLDRLIDVLSSKVLSILFEPDEALLNVATRGSLSVERGNKLDVHKIIQLDNLQRKAELSRVMSRRQSSINSTSSLKRSHSLTSSLDLDNESINSQDEPNRLKSFAAEVPDLKLRGADLTLSKLVSHFGDKLPAKLPKFWATITSQIKSRVGSNSVTTDVYDAEADSCTNDIPLIKSLRVLEVVGESLSSKLSRHLLDLFGELIQLLASTNPLIRHHSAQCIGVICKLMFTDTIDLVNKNIIPMLNQTENSLARCGSIEAIALIIEHLQLDLVPRINMFIIHVLRRMSDQNDQVRLMATHCFGKLLSLMPLNLEKANNPRESCDNKLLIENVQQQDDKNFIEQLLDAKKLDTFVMPFEMKTEPRSYQQDGLNWLAFLNRFNLHGILCDEMGLGKTYMTICMVASDHVKQNEEAEKSNSTKCPPSLIVCPSTLTEHWLYEVEKFLPTNIRSHLNPQAYSGILNDRMNLRCQILRTVNNSITTTNMKGNNPNQKLIERHLKPANLIVASYDMVRNDIDFFKEIHWNYCVLDEGHIIKNGKTKLSRAIRLLNAKHRLILSGTPIQNNVTELWSLFDFLMPGFLGSERQFSSRYAKPILQSRELKCSPRELEAGALAMESLHRQVLPFILRRLKEDVLDDLPPKIIQDYFCELSPLQHKLYEDFTRSKLCENVTKKSIHTLEEDDDTLNEATDQDAKANSKSHVFQALQYLKNVCNHPKLVLTERHSQYHEIKKSLDSEKGSLDDIGNSSKLKALKQLLIDCGIGATNQVDEQQQQHNLTIESVVNQHRALVFCQIRSMVQIIENDLLKKHLPSVTYLKLDGSVPPNQRHSIVSRFNNDPSIDILLLTTQIGGLGLNLTGADTVIFVEHDWNPTKDLQAMDRAHRIGQKKVVNVYRLITKGTLEEKIMGLQKFKTMVSNTVINQDNAGLRTMNVDQLLDLFEDAAAGDKSSTSDTCRQGDGGGKGSGKSKSSSFIDLLPELWDQQQYETEYDLSNFVSSLKN